MFCDKDAKKILRSLWYEKKLKGESEVHHYNACDPNFDINIIPQYTAVNNVSYLLIVKNNTDRIIDNLSVVVSFQGLPFFNHCHFVYNYEPEEMILAKTFFSVLDINGTAANVLELSKPVYPFVLATIFTHTASPYCSVTLFNNCLEQFEYQQDVATRSWLEETLKKECSVFLTHFDSLIAYDVYLKIRDGDDPSKMAITSTQKSTQSLQISTHMALSVWDAPLSAPEILKELFPMKSDNSSSLYGYTVVQEIFVEVQLVLTIDDEHVSFEITTPYETLSKLFTRVIKTKMFSLLKFQHRNERPDLMGYDYCMEKEMKVKGLLSRQQDYDFVKKAVNMRGSFIKVDFKGDDCEEDSEF